MPGSKGGHSQLITRIIGERDRFCNPQYIPRCGHADKEQKGAAWGSRKHHLPTDHRHAASTERRLNHSANMPPPQPRIQNIFEQRNNIKHMHSKIGTLHSEHRNNRGGIKKGLCLFSNTSRIPRPRISRSRSCIVCSCSSRASETLIWRDRAVHPSRPILHDYHWQVSTHLD